MWNGKNFWGSAGLAVGLGVACSAEDVAGTPAPTGEVPDASSPDDGAIVDQPAPADATARRPNIVILLADDLGMGDLGIDQGAAPTPNIDSLIRDGTRLSTFLVQPLCSPTRAALLTGRQPIRTGMNVGTINARQGEHLALEEITLAESLRANGYRTAAVGKWHLGDAPSPGGSTTNFGPTAQGFEQFLGFYGGGTNYLVRDPLGVSDQILVDETGAAVTTPGYSTDLFRDEAISFIRTSRTDPFFLYVAFNAVHETFPAAGVGPYSDSVPVSITDPDARRHAASLVGLDSAVGAIVSAVDDAGIGDDTIIVLLSDNGAMPLGSSGPYRAGKGSRYEGGIRSPAVIRWPGHTLPGADYKPMAASEDLYSTLLSLAGAQASFPNGYELDSKDFSSQLLQRRSDGPREEYTWIGASEDVIRTETHKLIRQRERLELYDLSVDPYETTDISSQNPALVASLTGRLDAAEAAIPAYPTHVPDATSVATPAAPAGKVLKIMASRRATVESDAALFVTLQVGIVPGTLNGVIDGTMLKTGDRFEYDIFVPADMNANRISLGIARAVVDGTPRQPGLSVFDQAVDQNGARWLANPSGAWAHRVFGMAGVTPGAVTASWLTIRDEPSIPTWTVYLDNVRIRRADGSSLDFFVDTLGSGLDSSSSRSAFTNITWEAVDRAAAP